MDIKELPEQIDTSTYSAFSYIFLLISVLLVGFYFLSARF